MRSPTINRLIDCLKKLPATGHKTAERYVYHWLKSGKKEVNELREALNALLLNTKSCVSCWDFTDTSPCPICSDRRRDSTRLCVVAEPPDMEALEKTGEYSGRYFILRGVVEMADEKNNAVKIPELLVRLKTDRQIKEVILGFNPDMPGETTMLYLKKEISELNPDIKITRLARGLPLGSDMQYADEITLASALNNRKKI